MLSKQQANNKYTQTQIYVGSGGQADVYIVIQKQTGLSIARKTMQKKVQDKKDIELIMKEAEYLISFHHKNLIKAYNYVQHSIVNMNKKCFYWITIYMEYFKGLDLRKLLTENPNIFNDQTILQIYKQICNGLNYLHDRGIVHNDLKLDNILFDNDTKTVKIIDLGIVRKLKNLQTETLVNPIQSTAIYKPPQYEEKNKKKYISKKSDYWNLGILILELSLKRALSPDISPAYAIQGFPEIYFDKIPERMKNIIENLIRVKHKQRKMIEISTDNFNSSAYIKKKGIKCKIFKKIIINNNIQLIESTIISSSYGNIYEGILNKNNNVPVYIRKIPASIFQDYYSEEALEVISKLPNLPKSKILKIIEKIESFDINGNFIYIVTDRPVKQEWESLEQLLEKEITFNEEQTICFIKQMCLAINQLNEYNLMHTGLRPRNIYVHKNSKEVKIGEIQLSKLYTDKEAISNSPPTFISPQGLSGQINLKCDVWTIGVIAFHLFKGKGIFSGCENLIKLDEAKRKYAHNVSENELMNLSDTPLLKFILSKMIVYQVEYRSLVKEILKEIMSKSNKKIKILSKINIPVLQTQFFILKKCTSQKYKSFSQQINCDSSSIQEFRIMNIQKFQQIIKLNPTKVVKIQKISIISNTRFQIIYEYHPKSIDDIMKTQHRNFTEEQLFKIMYKLLQIVVFIHKKGFRHCNLIPAIIFIDPQLNIKIGGFGFVQTPQINKLITTKFIPKNDLQQIGRIISRLSNKLHYGKKYFQEQNTDYQLIVNQKYTQFFKTLILKMISMNDRITTQDILNIIEIEYHIKRTQIIMKLIESLQTKILNLTNAFQFSSLLSKLQLFYVRKLIQVCKIMKNMEYVILQSSLNLLEKCTKIFKDKFNSFNNQSLNFLIQKIEKNYESYIREFITHSIYQIIIAFDRIIPANTYVDFFEMYEIWEAMKQDDAAIYEEILYKYIN